MSELYNILVEKEIGIRVEEKATMKLVKSYAIENVKVSK